MGMIEEYFESLTTKTYPVSFAELIEAILALAPREDGVEDFRVIMKMVKNVDSNGE